jgi:hypothetical protein
MRFDAKSAIGITREMECGEMKEGKKVVRVAGVEPIFGLLRSLTKRHETSGKHLKIKAEIHFQPNPSRRHEIRICEAKRNFTVMSCHATDPSFGARNGDGFRVISI